jgi:hypothetical protein
MGHIEAWKRQQSNAIRVGVKPGRRRIEIIEASLRTLLKGRPTHVHMIAGAVSRVASLATRRGKS